MKILVTGGAGYIGSFMVKELLEREFKVTVVDSLERGHKEAVDKNANLIIVADVFSGDNFGAVIHFAGLISMKESMENPGKYFENNVFASLNILEEMKKRKMGKFVFSSTAGIYGNPVTVPIPEDHPKNPENAYGESKLMVEKILSWYNKIYGIDFVSLRYFNACGASLDGTMGEGHNPETHIIPNAINAILNNSKFLLYGDDYDTPDGTCIRDYIHVIDLVEAHMLALDKLTAESGGYFYNVGTGKGHSNKKVLSMIEEVTNKKLEIEITKRRPGDANSLIADVSRIKKELNFEPRYSDLETIVKTAWGWHKKLASS